MVEVVVVEVVEVEVVVVVVKLVIGMGEVEMGLHRHVTAATTITSRALRCSPVFACQLQL